MRLYYLKEDSLYTLKHNKELVLSNLQKSGRDWIPDILGKDYLGETKIDCKDFNFYNGSTSPIESDIENAKIIYSALGRLNETQASDERLWAGMAVTIGYDYLIYRWGNKDVRNITYRWSFYTLSKRGMFYHGLARLWWYAHLTYDSKADNPYHLTEFAFSTPYIMEKMIYRNFSNSKTIRFSILKAMKDFVRDYGGLTTTIIAEVYKKISILGGCSILDAYSESELQQIVYEYIEKVYQSAKRGERND
jgi:hypothetical protein